MNMSRGEQTAARKEEKFAQQCSFDWSRADSAKDLSAPGNAVMIGAE